MSENKLNAGDLEHFQKVKDNICSKSTFITCGRFFTIAKCSKDLKLFKCSICDDVPGVFISADLSSVNNLKRSH